MLASFIIMSLISITLMFINWLFTYEVLGIVWNTLPKLAMRPRLKVMLIGIPIFLIHIAGIWLYAATYFVIENFTDFGAVVGHGRIPGITIESFMDCLYFSSATYTSLGLGDFVPTGDMRMLVAAEVLNGLVMIGWTISFTYLTMEKFWTTPKEKSENNHRHYGH